MFGEFQQSRLRIELDASEAAIKDSLLRPASLQQWQWPQKIVAPIPPQIEVGTVFTTQLGPVTTEHRVEIASDNHLRLILSRSVDGFHDWYWGEGWIQSCLEGVSLVPLGAGNALALMQLRRFLAQSKPQ